MWNCGEKDGKCYVSGGVGVGMVLDRQEAVGDIFQCVCALPFL